jgi:hypothetical protein
VGALVLLAGVLGFFGFRKLLLSLGKAHTPWDIFYLTIQLFSMQSGAVPGPKPWELELARFLAPSLSAFTAAKALLAIFHQHLQLLKLRFLWMEEKIGGLEIRPRRERLRTKNPPLSAALEWTSGNRKEK